MNTPAMPARSPEITTAMNLVRITLTPTDSEAQGLSPTERSRRPNVVRHRIHQMMGTRKMAPRVKSDRSVIRPRAMPAASEMKNQ